MGEMGFPVQFVNWVMLGVMTVCYRYMINGYPSEIFKAKRGVRQGDPISRFLFVLVIEYQHRVLRKLQFISHFNFHPRCEKFDIY